MTQTIEEISQENLTIEILRLFPRQGKWTEADYFRLPESNKIIELSEGRLIISPSPTTQHQMILGSFFSTLRTYVTSNKLGMIVISPMDVRLRKGIIRQPDIIFMSNEHLDRISNKRWGIPDLAIEVSSPGTKKEDRKDKYTEYEKAGIKEYWIIDPEAQTVEVLAMVNGRYELVQRSLPGEMASSRLLAGFEVSVGDLFRRA